MGATMTWKKGSQSMMGDDPDDNENKESPSKASSQWRGDKV